MFKMLINNYLSLLFFVTNKTTLQNYQRAIFLKKLTINYSSQKLVFCLCPFKRESAKGTFSIFTYFWYESIQTSAFMLQKIVAHFHKTASFSNLYFILFTILLIIEIKIFTYWRIELDPKNGVFTFLGVQLLIGILPFFILKHRKTIESTKPSLNIYAVILLSALAVWGIVYCFDLYMVLCKKVAIKPSNGDIIPQIQRFNKEFLAGRFPYTPFDDFGYRMSPTYLPAQWLPYLPSTLLKFDPRLITFGVFGCAYFVYLIIVIKQNIPFFKALILLGFPIFFVDSIAEFDPNVIAVTVEILIMSYYLLLSMSLTTHARSFQILMLVLCLMSRFSLVFWLPLYLFMLWTKEGFSPTLRFSLWIFAGAALLYGPFLAIDPHIFANSQTYYDTATASAWTYTPDSDHLNNGFSFVLFFHKTGGNIPEKIAAMKKLMLTITPLVSIVLGIIWWRFKDKLDSVLFSLCALKISLAVFYALIQFPFTYLYVTPIILSLAIFYRFTVIQKNNSLIRS